MDHDALHRARSRALWPLLRPAETKLVTPTLVDDDRHELAAVQQSAELVLDRLDALGEHQAAAFVSMALDAMRRARPDSLPTR